MATADEILSQLATEEDKVLVINNDLRTITIPQTVKMLGVESDEDVLRLHFRMPKTYGETDLSEFVIRINYINAKGIGDIYTVSDTSIVDDTITFSWLISRNATAYKGSVRFIVCLKLYDETGLLIKEYNTTVSSLPVLEGLEVSDIINTQNPDIIEKILLRLNKLEESGGVDVSGAQVGQTIRVSAVDESGKPTAWEATDFPEQMQSDWNQNDEAAPDYVKNRPFYTGDPVENIFVEESTVSFAETGNGHYGGQIQSTFVPTVGETYKVSWDGADYECTCIENHGILLLGDLNILFGMHDPADEPFLISARDGEKLEIITVDSSASHTFSVVSRESVAQVVKINPKYLPVSFKPLGGSYLTFSSSNNFTISVNNLSKNWDGTLEYFTSDGAWTVWDGTKPLVANANEGEYALYLRGIKNTVIAGPAGSSWLLKGTDIKCIGNIENLLDYATVKSGGHPNMSNSCYSYMFWNCTSLTQAPALPATTLTDSCYSYMFGNCTSLTQAPALPATTLTDSCYNGMFKNCTSLTQAPALPATTLADSCYYGMFENCTNLTKVPALPATTLAYFCYKGMFKNCTNLTKVPALPATTLANLCYDSMFYGCTSLKLSSTKSNEPTQEYRIPSSGNGITATNALRDMFYSTGGTFTGTPDINTTYYLSSDNMIVRETDISTLNSYVGSMINNAVPTALSDLSDDETHRTVTDEEKTAWSAKSDWNQNDETAADFVKNRPFYTGDLVEAEIADINALASSAGINWQLNSSNPNVFTLGLGSLGEGIKIGEEYKIIVNENEYRYTAVDTSSIFEEGTIGFGDTDAFSNSDISSFNNLLISDGVNITILCKIDTAPTSYKLYGQTQEIKKIDSKYLPDSVKNSEITINGKTIDKSNSLELIPSDIGASKIIYIEENNKRVAETLSEIKGYIDSGYDVRLIANSFGGIHMIRLNNDDRYVNISLVGDLHSLVVYSAFISSAGTVNFITWEEGNWYPDLDEREINLSKDSEGNWTCNKDLSYIYVISNYHPMLIVTLSDLGIAAISDGAIGTASEIKLPFTGIEQPELDSTTTKKRYIFSGTYGDYNITVTIGPTNSSNVTVTVENINSLPTVTEADNGKFLRVSGNAYVLEALTDVSEVGA